VRCAFQRTESSAGEGASKYATHPTGCLRNEKKIVVVKHITG
jgi:hypothetical protein